MDVDAAAELFVGKAEPKPPQASSAAACEATVAPAEEDDTVRQKENCGCSKIACSNLTQLTSRRRS